MARIGGTGTRRKRRNRGRRERKGAIHDQIEEWGSSGFSLGEAGREITASDGSEISSKMTERADEKGNNEEE